MHLGLFELLHTIGQQPILPPPFQAYDATHVNRPQYRELWAFNEFSLKRTWEDFDLSGILSPRFLEKMGIDMRQVLNFIHSNPEHDVYLFHPYPRELSLANNFLELAELEHPGITAELAFVWREIFSEELPQIEIPFETEICCHCNYFIGSPKFWHGYSSFVNNFMALMSKNERSSLHSLTPYSLSRTVDQKLPLAVFTFERSITHYLKNQQSKLKVINFSSSRQTQWSTPEVFSGEAAFVSKLLERISEPASNKEALKLRKNTAINAYYFYRKLWSEH